jgi:hypothetical protein
VHKEFKRSSALVDRIFLFIMESFEHLLSVSQLVIGIVSAA